ncbi:GNAT family N-acetyltransferase [Rossellomorea marisflavi]|uniref:GNAT family N-acetyltransferase n=1 Tax=Rossellomorea marisflavi TaxID=189381 RepID=UPI00345A36E7
MIIELDRSEFHTCKGLIHEQGHLEIKAVLERINPGRVFVDDPQTPTTGLVWLGNHDGFFFIGSETNPAFNQEINGFIDDVIGPEAKAQDVQSFIGIGHHERWEPVIREVFGHRGLEVFQQKVYGLETEHLRDSEPAALEEGYRLVKLSRDLYENRDGVITNPDFLQSKILEFWATPEDFFQEGMGYAVMHHDEVVSLCFSGFLAGDQHTIDIETLEEHQGKGLGLAVAHRVINEGLKQGLRPYWDCMEINTPSNAIARRLGLVNVFDYEVYMFSL